MPPLPPSLLPCDSRCSRWTLLPQLQRFKRVKSEKPIGSVNPNHGLNCKLLLPPPLRTLLPQLQRFMRVKQEKPIGSVRHHHGLARKLLLPIAPVPPARS